jgi:hypothetical protein
MFALLRPLRLLHVLLIGSALTLTLTMAPDGAFADKGEKKTSWKPWKPWKPSKPSKPTKPPKPSVKVPEINGELAGGGLALALGGVAVVLGRRRRKIG